MRECQGEIMPTKMIWSLGLDMGMGMGVRASAIDMCLAHLKNQPQYTRLRDDA